MFLRKLYYFLTPGLRRLVRRIYYFPTDLLNVFFRRRPALVPPQGRIFTGQGDFVAIGDNFLNEFIETCQLKPDYHVLDVGCGLGRMARPLVFYLDQKGKYDGFDIVKDGVSWCKKHYAAYENFSFTHVSLDNDLYHLGSGHDATSFNFPYRDNDYDLVVLISVFTHMQSAEVQQYLHEIQRVLKPGGRCFATFFLLTPSSDEQRQQPAIPFHKHDNEGVYLHDRRVKNANVGYSYELVEKMAKTASLSIEQFHQGWWSGHPKESCKDFQDILVFRPFI